MSKQPPKRLTTRTVTNPAPGVPVQRPAPKPKRPRESARARAEESFRREYDGITPMDAAPAPKPKRVRRPTRSDPVHIVDGTACIHVEERTRWLSPPLARRLADALNHAAAWIEQEQRKGAKR